jgi:hypothetical protein
MRGRCKQDQSLSGRAPADAREALGYEIGWMIFFESVSNGYDLLCRAAFHPIRRRPCGW